MSARRRLVAPFVLLEDRLTKSSKSSLFIDPEEIVSCWAPQDLDGAWAKIEAGLKLGLHAAGFFSFELGYCSEPRLLPLLPAGRTMPLVWLGLFREPLCLSAQEADALFADITPPPPIRDIEPMLSKAVYERRVEALLGRIGCGDVYQVNLTFPLRFRHDADPLTLYAALRSRQRVAHGAMIGLHDLSILSVSPELFVEIDHGSARSRPMKGTVARHADPVMDAEAAERLARDPKQRAENLMIVDLLRNDLSRISQLGSVSVPSLFDVESFPTLHTMTSTIESQLRSGTGPRETIEALFPCGSVVGAPKHRAMELIRSTEDTPRGVYTGAIGAIHPDGKLSLNVAIRTSAIYPDGMGIYGVGGGIVADSDPKAEWDECLLKARVLTDLGRDYGLIETLRWAEGEGYRRLARHLGRLERSAAALGFAFDRAILNHRLTDLAATLPGGDHRIRIELSRNGSIATTSAPIAPASQETVRVMLSAIRLDTADPFLRHKTTVRDLYEAAFDAASLAGFDDAIMLNQYDSIADCSRHSVFIELDGRLYTPPISSGALPGILRQTLIDQGEVEERVLIIKDLELARRLYIGNSLRGLREAVFQRVT